MSRRIQTGGAKARCPGRMEIQNTQSYGQSPPSVDNRDQIGILRIVIGQPVAVVTKPPGEKLSDCARAALGSHDQPGFETRLFRDFLQMASIGLEIPIGVV